MSEWLANGIKFANHCDDNCAGKKSVRTFLKMILVVGLFLVSRPNTQRNLSPLGCKGYLWPVLPTLGYLQNSNQIGKNSLLAIFTGIWVIFYNYRLFCAFISWKHWYLALPSVTTSSKSTSSAVSHHPNIWSSLKLKKKCLLQLILKQEFST